MKKRLVIVVFYDSSGVVDEYVMALLKANKIIADRQVLIVNGKMINNFDHINAIVDQIIIRDNEGYDAEAYKHFFLHHFSQSMATEYDEIVLMNDTFFGPFYQWKDILDLMEPHCYDAWGLTKHSEGSWPNGEYMPEHIQAYFWVIRKNVINDAFFSFWENLPKIKSYHDAVIEFEIGFHEFIRRMGFSIGCYIDVASNGEYEYENEVQFISDSYNLISKYKLPIIKKRAFLNPSMFLQIEKSFDYIREHYSYSTELISSYLNRKEYEGAFRLFRPEKLISFYDEHKRVYIYGAGKWGQKTEKFLDYKGRTISGFIVTNTVDKNLYTWDSVKICPGDGVIIAGGKAIWKEMLNEARKYMNDKDILSIAELIGYDK